ncbi:hypothetical protein LKMONMHP_2204 [Methylobacterium organophilum]|uniref:DUF2141 domain-containing protein n=1 Tax=Methylobacterium organophilum TaxID=410 RepID=A0ABQ4T6S1_METOR|nr:hypothetical protein LKMONMHP_2204 [Methylobacterium organophilum]
MIRAAAGAGGFLAALALVPGQAAGLDVTVSGIEPGGTLYVALCQGGLSEEACRIGQDAPAAGASQRFVFRDLPPGIWAVAAFQDRNGNRRLDRTPLGLPREPYAFSGGGRRARPDFASASFRLNEPGAALHLQLVRALPPR